MRNRAAQHATLDGPFGYVGPGIDRLCAPVIDPPGDQEATQGQRFSLLLHVGSLNLDDITVTVSNLPDGLSFDEAKVEIAGAVGSGVALGDHTVTVQAEDDFGSSTVEFDIEVLAHPNPFASLLFGTVPGRSGHDDGVGLIQIGRFEGMQTLEGSFGTVAGASATPEIAVGRTRAGAVDGGLFGTVDPPTGFPEIQIDRRVA